MRGLLRSALRGIKRLLNMTSKNIFYMLIAISYMFMALALFVDGLWIIGCFLFAFIAWIVAIYKAVEGNIRGGGG
jgi:uncharacterized membrane protein